MPFAITALYAGLNGLILLTLSLHAARARGRTGILIGTGGDASVERAMRAHSNAAEHIPIVLILIGALELNGANTALLHGLGIALTMGRALHGWGLSHSSGPSFARSTGMILTNAALAIGAAAAILTGLNVI